MFQATAEAVAEPSNRRFSGHMEHHMFRSTDEARFAGRTEHVMFQKPPGLPVAGPYSFPYVGR
jgi:hypothetical protein